MAFVIPKKKAGETEDLKMTESKSLENRVQSAASESAATPDKKKTPKRKQNKEKDSNAPKRPPSGFMIWSQENRAAIRADLGNLTMPELSKELGRRWAALEVADRLTYEHKAKAAKEEYHAALSAYTPPPVPAGQPKKGAFKLTKKERKAARDPAAPRKPLSSFMLWSQQEREVVRAELSSGGDAVVSLGDIGKELGRRWQSLGEDKKKEFEQQATAAKEQYHQALAAYQPSQEFLLKRQQLLQQNEKKMSKKQTAKAKDPAAPKRPMSAFLLWAAANREQVKADLGTASSGGPDMLRELGRRWGQLAEDAKAGYEAQSRADMEKYRRAVVAYKLNHATEQPSVSPKVSVKEKSAKVSLNEKEKSPAGKQSSSSPFQVWSREHRGVVKEEMGGKVTSLELNKELARRWKALDKTTKVSYKVKRDSESSTSTGGEDKENKAASPAKRPKLSKKSVPKVRKARAPFYFYLLEVSPKIMAESVDKKSSKQVLEIAQQQWATLTREEQERFTELAREDDQRYSQEKELKKGQPEKEEPETKE